MCYCVRYKKFTEHLIMLTWLHHSVWYVLTSDTCIKEHLRVETRLKPNTNIYCMLVFVHCSKMVKETC